MLRFVVLSVLLAVASASIIKPHIIGSEETTIQQHPYQASLLKHGKHACGAVILSSRHILSTAHCLYTDGVVNRVDQYQLSLGSTNRTQGKLYSFVKITPHEQFRVSLSTFDYNVAVGVLSEPIVFSDSAQPVVLVPEDQPPKAGEVLTISGWGSFRYSKESVVFPEILRAVRIPTVDTEECKNLIGPDARFITHNMFCAGGVARQKESLGDIGGAVVNGKKELVGIFSFGSRKDYLDTPSVYTSIASPAIRRFVVEKIEE